MEQETMGLDSRLALLGAGVEWTDEKPPLSFSEWFASLDPYQQATVNPKLLQNKPKEELRQESPPVRKIEPAPAGSRPEFITLPDGRRFPVMVPPGMKIGKVQIVRRKRPPEQKKGLSEEMKKIIIP